MLYIIACAVTAVIVVLLFERAILWVMDHI